MAISDDRLKSRNIVKLVETDFISSCDRGEDQPASAPKTNIETPVEVKSSTNQKAVSTGKASVFDTATSVIDQTFDAALDVFTGSNCNLGNNRDIGPEIRDLSMPTYNGYDANCLNDINSLLQTTNVLNNYTETLSDNSLYNLEELMKEEFSGYNKYLSKVNINANNDTNITKGVNLVTSMLDFTGATLKQKQSITDPLICDNTASSFQVGELDYLKDISFNIALGLIKCLPLEKVLSFVSDLMTGGLFTRGDILAGIMATFDNKDDPDVLTKVKMVSAIANNGGVVDPADYIKTQGKTNLLLSAVGNLTTDTKTPSLDYTSIDSSLTNIDNSWNKDTNGNYDYTTTANNKYLASLSAKSINAESDFDGTLTTIPKPYSDEKLKKIHILTNNQDTICELNENNNKDSIYGKSNCGVTDETIYIKPPIKYDDHSGVGVVVDENIDNADIELNNDGSISKISKSGVTTTYTINGDVITSDSKETQTVFKDKSILTVDNNGNKTYIYSNGTKEEINNDGSKTITYTNGNRQITKADGTVIDIAIGKDGSTIKQYSNGDTVIIEPNGDYTKTTLDGKVYTTTINGDKQITINPDGSEEITIKDKYGIETITTSNGDKIIKEYRDDNITYTYSDGSIRVEYTDGSIMLVDKNGIETAIDKYGVSKTAISETEFEYITKDNIKCIITVKDNIHTKICDDGSKEVTTYFDDGSKETIMNDGVVKKEDGSGKQTLEYINGDILTIDPSGEKVLVKPNGVKIITFSNGIEKTVYTNGNVETKYTNGKICKTVITITGNLSTLCSDGNKYITSEPNDGSYAIENNDGVVIHRVTLPSNIPTDSSSSYSTEMNDSLFVEQNLITNKIRDYYNG